MTAEGRETPPAPTAWWNGRLAWWAIFTIAVAFRLLFFSGYGLGDDPNYFSAYYGIVQSGTWSEQVPYDFRFTFWAGVVAFLRLFGVTEWGWVGFITLCSILNVVITYALARQEWERPWALLAMLLIAVLPLEVVTSTLFAIDIPLATYCYAGFWLYRVGCDRRVQPWRRALAAVVGGVFLFIGYSAKQWGVLIGAIIAIEALTRIRETWRASVLTGGTFAALIAAYFGWQWWRFGDPIYDVHLVRKVAIFEPHMWTNQLDYWKMLLLPSEYGTYFAGWYPHVLFVLAVVFATRVRAAGKWLLYFLVEMFCLTSVPSHYDKGQWWLLIPHIFRYLCFISIPVCIALAGYLRELIRWRPRVGLAFTAMLLVWTAVQAVQLSWPTRDAFGEQRRANALILSIFPDERVWSDWGFLGRLFSFAPDRRMGDRVREIKPEEPVAQARELAKVTDGIVVTGGARLPWYGCIRCALSVSAFTPPPTWTLVTMYGEGEVGPYRKEPMRIWRVSPAVQRANELFAERLDEASRLALLRELVQRNDNATAAEVGRRLVEQGVAPRGTVAYLTGLACARTGKPACARAHYSRALDDVLSPGEARQIILTTLAGGTPTDIETAREWLTRFRKRFPNETIDAAMEEGLSGFTEAMALLRTARYAEAATKFREIRDRKTESAYRRKQAHYFAVLAAYRVPGAVDQATREADEYRRLYGEDEFSAELRYREGEARVRVDPEGARRIFTDIAKSSPDTLWGKESQKQLAALGAAAPGTTP